MIADRRSSLQLAQLAIRISVGVSLVSTLSTHCTVASLHPFLHPFRVSLFSFTLLHDPTLVDFAMHYCPHLAFSNLQEAMKELTAYPRRNMKHETSVPGLSVHPSSAGSHIGISCGLCRYTRDTACCVRRKIHKANVTALRTSLVVGVRNAMSL